MAVRSLLRFFFSRCPVLRLAVAHIVAGRISFTAAYIHPIV
jgi:hypothetical protein